MIESATLNRVALAMVHELSGLGRLPPLSASHHASLPEVRQVQVAVVGGGPAGRAAAEETRAAGLDTVVIDRELTSGSGVLGGMHVIGFYDDRYLVAVSDDRHVWVEPKAIILATGAVEQLPPVPGNDLPGIFSRRAVERALDRGILPGRRVVVAADPAADDSTRRRGRELVKRLLSCGARIDVTLALGPDTGAANPLDAGLHAVEGRSRVRRVIVDGGIDTFECDALVWCGRPVPAYELPRQLGLETPYVAIVGGFVPEHEVDGHTARAGLYIAGELAGLEADHAAAHGVRVGETVVAALVGRTRPVEVS
jgi:sarcosine oxidase, subunit alpha